MATPPAPGFASRRVESPWPPPRVTLVVAAGQLHRYRHESHPGKDRRWDDDVGGQIWRSSSMACISRKHCQEPWLVEKRKGGRGTTGKKMDKNYKPRFHAPTLLRLVVESHGWLRGGMDVEMGAASLVPSLATFSPKVAAARAGGRSC